MSFVAGRALHVGPGTPQTGPATPTQSLRSDAPSPMTLAMGGVSAIPPLALDDGSRAGTPGRSPRRGRKQRMRLTKDELRGRRGTSSLLLLSKLATQPFGMRPFTLGYFDGEAEAEFMVDFMEGNAAQIQAVYGLGTVVCGLMMVPAFLADDGARALENVLCYVIGVLLPAVAAVVLSRSPSAFSYSAAMAASTALLVLCGCSVVVGRALLQDSLQDPQRVMELAVLFFGFGTLLRLRFILAALGAFVVTLFFAGAALVSASSSERSGLALWTHLGYALGLAILYCFNSFLAEHDVRLAFLHKQREEHAHTKLTSELNDLKKAYRPVNLDTPMEKVVGVLKNLLQSPFLSHEHAQDVDFAISVLGTANLFKPNIRSQLDATTELDEETTRWLSEEVAAGEGPMRGSIAHTNAPSRLLMQSIRRSSSAWAQTNEPSGSPAITRRRLPNSRVPSYSTISLTPEEEKDLREQLAGLATWTFDVFRVAQLTHGHPLLFVGVSVFEQRGLLKKFDIQPTVLRSFLLHMEASYHAHPYHNATHAADVLQTAHFMLTNPMMEEGLSDLEIFACVFAAIIHDVDHPGTNNRFHVASKSDLAYRYNDRAVLENHHCATAFNLVRGTPGIDILAGLDGDDYAAFRTMVIELVLSTDMGMHFDVLSQFKGKVAAGIEIDDDDLRLLLMKMVIKISDISNPAKQDSLYKRWYPLVLEEFFRQGDQEKMLGLSVSPFMDRSKPALAKSQIGFIDYVCLPLFEALAEFLDIDWLPRMCHTNREEMVRIEEGVEAAPIQSHHIQPEMMPGVVEEDL